MFSPPWAGSNVAKPSFELAKIKGKSACGVGRPKRYEQIKHLVHHFVRPGVGPIDLVDHHDRPHSALEGLRQHETRLRHGPFRGVDQQQGPVRHAHHPLHFAAKIGVARRVDDVDLHPVVWNRDILGQDRYPPFPLQFVGVQDALALKLGFAKPAALAHMQSTSVVLPWSTWAIMATLRVSL